MERVYHLLPTICHVRIGINHLKLRSLRLCLQIHALNLPWALISMAFPYIIGRFWIKIQNKIGILLLYFIMERLIIVQVLIYLVPLAYPFDVSKPSSFTLIFNTDLFQLRLCLPQPTLLILWNVPIPEFSHLAIPYLSPPVSLTCLFLITSLSWRFSFVTFTTTIIPSFVSCPQKYAKFHALGIHFISLLLMILES